MHGGDNNQKVEDVFKDFKARRAGILKALTTEVREFFQQCDPAKENLCLYGLPNEQWAVKEPVENVPPEIPEPALGINFARDDMQQKEWLSIVALHSDTWLLAVAFYYSSYFKFDKADRARLFNMMNDLPTLLEVVSPPEKQQKGKGKEKSTVSNRSTNRSRSSSKSSVNPRKSSKRRPKYEEADMDDVEYDDDGGGNTLCGGCGGKYADDVDEFWICCDVCEIWFHGKCVRITPSQAEHIDKYKCPACNGTKRPPF